ncbi:ATP-binding protein [Pseudorhodoferax soli]|uniref:histidine kinase n=1 Tax=Pseudorhodoferax soli TaxID=545864 RepID=A0A368Y5A6_9BURK|nr:ATP-binding protein [Pseudorhodoferax soli]RCW75470.1 PAS domain S-box-containing protein [Pseudorhodoferax soli]
MKPHAWRLADHLTALLLVAMLVSSALAGGALLLYRIPEIGRQGQALLQREVDGMAARLVLLPQTVEGQLAQVGMLLDQVPAGQADSLLDTSIDNAQVAVAMYRLGPDGRIQQLGLPRAQRDRRAALLGRDLSRSRLFASLPGGAGMAWDGGHLSPVSGAPTLAAAVRDRQGHAIVVELSAEALVRTVALVVGGDAAPMWVVGPGGDVVAHTVAGAPDRPDLQAWLQAAAAAPAAAAPVLRWDGRAWLAAVAAVPALGWRIVGRMPSGLDHPQVRQLLVYNGLAVAASLLAAIVMALLWARRMGRPLQQTVARARRAMAGELPLAPAQRSTVVEFNQLAQEIEAMAVVLHERELSWQSIFDAAPLAMGVSDTRDAMRLLAVNAAWCRDFGFAREEAVGRSPVELGMFAEPPTREAMDAVIAAGPVQTELRLLRRDRQELLIVMFGPHPVPGSDREVIWASMDIGPLRQAEHAVRELNQQLEARVAQRTEALAGTHAALTQTVEQLRLAQAELVHAEKMAALGALVAGIAHELQTPLGNSLLALGSLVEVLECFQQASQAGLRRADLQTFLAGVEEGAEIAERSLRRAADLVQNFKQVAVDQTSAQRRPFELHAVVRDMAASLRPGLAGTPYAIDVELPASGLLLDSYPGALGQTLGQLVHNAVLHGFAGRDHGRVHITGGRGEDGQVWLRVADDGWGIAAERLAGLFDPFAAGRAGPGTSTGPRGAGLGLYIAANAVATLLGGRLTVHSTQGQGACFELRLPDSAPGRRSAGGDTPAPWQPA